LHFSAETLKSAVIHRKWLSFPSLTTKTIDFQQFLLLIGGKTEICDLQKYSCLNKNKMGSIDLCDV